MAGPAHYCQQCGRQQCDCGRDFPIEPCNWYYSCNEWWQEECYEDYEDDLYEWEED